MTKPRSGHFSIIPAAAVFDHRLSHADVRVLAALAAHANKERRCWPAVSTLADEIGMSKRHALRCLQSLASHGYLQIEKRSRRSSIYQLQVTWVSPDKPQWSDTHVTTSVTPMSRIGDTRVTQNDLKNDTKNDYTFAGKIIRLNQRDYDTWAKAYSLVDLRAQLQALDDYYDNHLTGGDRNKWYARCSQALAKKNERARAEQAQQREEPKFNDGVY